MNPDIILHVNRVSHWFPSHKEQFTEKSKRILWDVNLDIIRGQFLALCGPSGCGKSTLLYAILGTQVPASGEITLTRSSKPPKLITKPTGDIGIVYQQYSLFEFLTSEENVAFGLSGSKKQRLATAKEMLERVDVTKAIGLYPADLSGGMRQRVAIAQALVMKPKVLLLDEPFGALDEATREDLQGLLLTLYQENMTAKAKGEKPPYTMVIVTHELNEAFYLADRIVGLSQFWAGWSDKDDCKYDFIPVRDGQHCGATVCFDQACPVFGPNDPRNFDCFYDQKQLLRKVVFDGNNTYNIEQYLTYWNDYNSGKAKGIGSS